MCGRYEFHDTSRTAADAFAAELAENADEVEPSWNIAPTRPVLAVAGVRGENTRRLGALRWGLIPYWAKQPAGTRWINARSETVATQPAFRDAFTRRRCLIPANGWFEWRASPASSDDRPAKTPWRLYSPENPILALAGIWDTWRDAEGRTLRTCAILTTEANRITRWVHDRMPLIVGRDAWDTWLAPRPLSEAERAELLRPAPDGLIVMDEISNRVGNVANDDPGLIEPTGSTYGLPGGGADRAGRTVLAPPTDDRRGARIEEPGRSAIQEPGRLAIEEPGRLAIQEPGRLAIQEPGPLV